MIVGCRGLLRCVRFGRSSVPWWFLEGRPSAFSPRGKGRSRGEDVLELEGAELLVDDLPDDLVGRHGEMYGGML
jgi:hypothetical protein